MRDCSARISIGVGFFSRIAERNAWSASVSPRRQHGAATVSDARAEIGDLLVAKTVELVADFTFLGDALAMLGQLVGGQITALLGGAGEDFLGCAARLLAAIGKAFGEVGHAAPSVVDGSDP